MHEYLESTEYIDWKAPEVLAKAKSLAEGLVSLELIAEKCFVFVRDKIKHSWDYECDPVTCKASDVLSHGTGYCYAKSHLLAALLRANGIPAGLCYQRLTISNDKPPFCLHGLNAVYLERHGWGGPLGVRPTQLTKQESWIALYANLTGIEGGRGGPTLTFTM